MKNGLRTVTGFIAGILVTALVLVGVTAYASDGTKDGELAAVLLLKLNDINTTLDDLHGRFVNFSDEYTSFSRLSRDWMECQNSQCIQSECISSFDCYNIYDINNMRCIHGTCYE